MSAPGSVIIFRSLVLISNSFGQSNSFFLPFEVAATYFFLSVRGFLGFVCRWSGRGPVTHGGAASSAAGELRGQRGIVGTCLFTSPETYKDNLRDGMRSEIEGDLREKD